MPDLNLIDEGSLEETPAPPAPVARRGGGGGGSRGVIIVVVLIIVLGGGGFFLYKKGIFPFKKKPVPVTQVQEEQVPPEPADQNMAQQEQAAADTSAVSLVETTPIVEKGSAKKGSDMKGMKPESAPSGSESLSGSAGKLSEMKGNYTIQVVAFHEQKKAEEIVQNLEDADYPAFVEKVPLKEGDWYTVRIGRYPTAKEARNAVKTFGSQLQSSYFIDRVRASQ